MKWFITLKSTGPVILMLLPSLYLFTCERAGNQNSGNPVEFPGTFTIGADALKDKIMGGWAGQVIGCTYGGPTEFDFRGTMIQDYTPIGWDGDRMEWYYDNAPGLYDDVYMDLTFVDVIEKEGVDAPASSHARAFAHAGYALWHANQAARYNILQGMEPPASGYWMNNPHADDIDFQIEADFAGLMNPGMVNSSSGICDRVGHIMNYGDGWYGGVYMAAMYALAFYSDDVEFVVTQALRSIPEGSQFYRCINDVIGWCREFPDDWKRTWFETEKRWSSDIGCPDGVFDAFNIDAKINAAYVVIGLMYGKGDFGRTVEISTRCGQDSDCNPASAGGILGTMLGYSSIPEFWKQGLDKVENRDFKYTTLSLNEVYEMSYRHALEMIRRNGGETGGEEVIIRLEEPVPVRSEKAFEGHYPTGIRGIPWEERRLLPGAAPEQVFSFYGKGFVLLGGAVKEGSSIEDEDLRIEVLIDGTTYETASLPTSFQARRHEVTWAYNLEEGDHVVRLVWKNPKEGYRIDLDRLLIYGPDTEL